MRRELKTLVLVATNLSFVALVASGLSVASSGVVSSRANSEVERAYLLSRQQIDLDKQDLLKETLRYRQDRISQEQQDFERNLEIMRE